MSSVLMCGRQLAVGACGSCSIPGIAPLTDLIESGSPYWALAQQRLLYTVMQ